MGANGKITVEAAVERDTQAGSARSSGATLGVTAQVGLAKGVPRLSGPTVSAGVSSSRSGYAGETVTNVNSALSSGGTTTVITPGALVLDGGTISGRRVVGDVGSLAIGSRQDTSRYDARSRGVSGSVGIVGGVIASTAEASRNSLTTRTLHASDL